MPAASKSDHHQNSRLAVLWLICIPFILLASVTISQTRRNTTVTRASRLPAIAVGVGENMHFEDYMRRNPGSRTAILSYAKMDGQEVRGIVNFIRMNVATQNKLKRDFWPQIALETQSLSLSEFTQQLSRRGSLVDMNVRMLAAEIARHREQHRYFFIRPFSEMNDGTDDTPWEFANKFHRNNGTDLALAWKKLHDVFDEEGASNAIFIFSPLAANRVHNEKEVLVAMEKIPVGYIDCFGLNVYSRPRNAYGGTSPDPIPFSELVNPWLKLLQTTRHRGVPLAVAEMGVSNQATDAARARWLKDAFTFARAQGFVMLTYFNYPHPYWTIAPNTLTGDTLREGMNQYSALNVTDMLNIEAQKSNPDPKKRILESGTIYKF